MIRRMASKLDSIGSDAVLVELLMPTPPTLSMLTALELAVAREPRGDSCMAAPLAQKGARGKPLLPVVCVCVR